MEAVKRAPLRPVEAHVRIGAQRSEVLNVKHKDVRKLSRNESLQSRILSGHPPPCVAHLAQVRLTDGPAELEAVVVPAGSRAGHNDSPRGSLAYQTQRLPPARQKGEVVLVVRASVQKPDGRVQELRGPVRVDLPILQAAGRRGRKPVTASKGGGGAESVCELL